MSDKKQAKTRVDEGLYEKIAQHPESMAKILREGAKMYMGDGDKKQLKDDLRDAITEFERANRKYKTWEERRDDRYQELHRLARELHEFKEPEEAYEEWLEGVLDEYQSVDDHKPLIMPVIGDLDGFDKCGKMASEVRDDLKRLAVEQERELTSDDFERETSELKSIQNSPDRYLYEMYKINGNGELELRDRKEAQRMVDERLERDRDESEEQRVTNNS